MSKKVKDFKVPSRRQPIWKPVRGLLSFFMFGKIKVINLSDEMPDKCIMVGNHAGKNGPVAYDKFLPIFHATWGAGQMLGNYKSRYNYLRNVLYIQKCGKSKFYATIKASFEAIFSPMIYKGIKILGTHTDMRFAKTLKNSAAVLNSNASVLIFPEDSSEGYFDELTRFFGGFVSLSEYYYKKSGEDLPVYPVYLHLKSKKLIIGKPKYVNELAKQGASRDEICEILKNEVNSLYKNYVLQNK